MEKAAKMGIDKSTIYKKLVAAGWKIKDIDYHYDLYKKKTAK